MKYLLYGAPVVVTEEHDLEKKFHETGLNTGNLVIGNAVNKHLGNRVVSRILFGDQIPNNGDFDAIVIPASNFIREDANYDHIINELNKSNVPIITIGLGSQASNITSGVKLNKSVTSFLNLLSDRSPSSIGVRGFHTAEVLFDNGIKNIDVIGCPTAFYRMDPEFQIQRKKYNELDIISNIAVGPQFTDFVKDLAKNKIPVVLQDELFIIYKEFNGSDYRKVYSFLNKYKIFFNTEDWIRHLRNYDLMIGPRMHGNMLALQSGLMAIWLSHDSRTSELIDYIKLPNINISDFSYKHIEKLYHEIDIDTFNKNFKDIYAKYTHFLDKNNIKHDLPIYNHRSVSDIYKYNSFLNTKEKIRSKTFDEKSITEIKKIKSLKKIDLISGKIKFKPNKFCVINVFEKNLIKIQSLNHDPFMELQFEKKLEDFIIIELKITSQVEGFIQLFYTSDTVDNYNEMNSQKRRILIGKNDVCFFINDKGSHNIRLDPINHKGNLDIEDLNIFHF